MAEENPAQAEASPVEETQAPQAPLAGGSPAPGGAAEEVTDLAPEATAQAGNAPDAEIEKLRPICSLAEQNYNQILGLIKEIKAAEAVLHQFRARAAGVTPQNVEEAKGKFNTAKQSYVQMGNQINDGIKQVYTAATTYPDDLLVQSIYKVYLAKLLASLETRNPTQHFVAVIAAGDFEMERAEFAPTEDETARGLTAEALEGEALEKTRHAVNMLEVRYQKRQCANRMRHGESPAKIINQLTHLLRRDPDDINTYIWLANLLSDALRRERNQNARVSMRDSVLDYCKRAFGKIDDYLNLQGIDNLNERDRQRAEYVKTITSIRKPLLEQG